MCMKDVDEIVLLHQDPCSFQCPSNQGEMGPWSQHLIPIPDVLFFSGLRDESKSWVIIDY